MRLLLDEHISPVLANQLCKRGIDAVALRDWQGGRFLQRSDEEILTTAYADSRTFVTYDRRTISPLVKKWAEQERSHGGIIFVDNSSIAPNDLGGLLRSLLEMARRFGDEEWRDRIVYLDREKKP